MHQTSVSQLAHPASSAEALNGDCHSAMLNRTALQHSMQAQGEAWHGLVAGRCPHLFADVPVFISAAQMRQMREVIGAVERVVALPGWDVSFLQATLLNPLPIPSPQSSPASGRGGERERPSSIPAGEEANVKSNFQSLGVFYGYDFHLNSDGAHLIEINTNAGGGFLNALLIESQLDTPFSGAPPVHADASAGSAQGTQSVSKHASSPFDTSGRTDVSLNDVFIEMFRNEWRLARGEAPLSTVAIVDEQPESQYLYPEFLLAQRMFERAGIAAYIADPAAFQAHSDGLYLNDQKIDLVYNRLTDFSLRHHPVLRQAYLDGSTVVTPSPAHYARYADKRNLARLTDAGELRTLDANEADIAALQAGVPRTIAVKADMEETLWQERRQWFFKPNSGYGSKGAYRGEKLTKRVFAEILQGDYVAQKLAVPGERSVCVNDAEPVSLKYDVRCYVYGGRVQLVAARLYQGQTTNFRTPGGGFALVRVVE